MTAFAEGYYTIRDVYDLPDGERAELVDGQLYMTTSPLPYHERICPGFHLNLSKLGL